ncbi:asparagine synthase (glutamine-hydrolyzing) [Nanoarchaeota archaeon]
MCGIVGFNWEDSSLIRKCTDIIAHRGPDADGFHTSRGISLGQRRLAVIDTSDKGNQPMYSGDYCIVYNGETYNYNELKKSLKKKRSFNSSTDTEVILYLLEEQGPKCLNLLQGMFALALWDSKKKELFVARDRFGIKPLYYYWDKKKFIFSSEIKAILETGVKREIDKDALNNYLTYKFSLGPKTLFKNIYKLQPGHYLILKDGKLEVSQWYDLNYKVTDKPKDYYIKGIRKRLDKAVERRLVADVPLGAFLSGGIDSSAIVATMAKLTDDVKTFSVGFEEAKYDELEHARKIASDFHTDHHEITMNFDHIRELLPKITWHLDEPFGDFACIPTHMISEFARKKVTVCLSGDGGDESFVGYRHSIFQHKGRIFTKLPSALQRLGIKSGSVFLNETSKPMRAMKVLSEKDDSVRSLGWNRFMDDDAKKHLLSNDMKNHIGAEKEIISGYNSQISDYDELNKNLYVEFKTWLPDDALFKVDKMSMMNSLEVRVPFLDHELAEFMASCPVKYKAQGTKHLLKEALADRLPSEIINRKKHGFNIPTDKWYRNELKDFAEEVLSDRKLKPYLNPNAVAKILKKHQSGYDYSYQLNTLLSFGLWHKIFMQKFPYEKLTV